MLKFVLFYLIIIFPVNSVELEGIPLGNGYLPDEMSLSSVAFVGAHNSSIVKNDWLYYQQEVDLDKQFNIFGVRAFKIPLHWYSPKDTYAGQFFSPKDPYIALCHEPDGRTNCQVSRLQRLWTAPEPALHYLIQLRKLLESHPREIVILMVESYLSKKSALNGMSQDPVSLKTHMAQLIDSAGLTPYLFHLGEQYTDSEWPTLGDLRDLNQRLIIISDDKKDGLDNVSLYRETGFEYAPHQLLDPKKEKMRGNGRDTSGNSHFFLMNHFTQWSIPNTSTHGFLLDLLPEVIPNAVHENLEAVDYEELNSYPVINSRIDHLEKLEGRYPNIILLDFVNHGYDGGAQRAVYELNVRQLSYVK